MRRRTTLTVIKAFNLGFCTFRVEREKINEKERGFVSRLQPYGQGLFLRKKNRIKITNPTKITESVRQHTARWRARVYYYL